MMIGLAVVARPLIIVLFSTKWEGCVVFFQLMCAGGLLYPLHLINLDILKVKGRSDLFFRITLIKRALIILNILITFRWGINAMLSGQIAISAIAYFLNSYYSEKMIGYPVKTQVLDVLPAFLFSCLMGGGALLVGQFMRSSNNFVLLVAQSGVGAGLYLFVSWVSRSEAMFELIKLVKQLLIIRANSLKPLIEKDTLR